MATTMDDIRDYARRLAEAFHPEKIILFGSWARGEQHPDSDVDLMVVMPLDGSAVRKAVEIEMQIPPRFALDLLVVTPSLYREKLSRHSFFFEQADARGIVLHAL